MLKLIGKVELRLRQIDELLAQAGAAPRAVQGQGLRTAELVRRSQEEGQAVIEGIDKILELADHAHRGKPGHGA
jgi:hypothetical protein